jgi:hypothetical protein
MSRVGALLVVLVAALCVGCGSSSGNDGAGNGNGSSSGARSGLAAFSSCLKQHGVKSFGGGQPPGRGAPPSGGQQPSGGCPPGGGSFPQLSGKVQKAFSACQKYLPAGGQGGFAPPPGG